MRLHGFLMIAGAVLVCTGCPHEADRLATYQEPSLQPVVHQLPVDAERPPFVAGSGDILAVQVSGQPETRHLCQIGLDGMLTYPPGACTIFASGASLDEIAQRLAAGTSKFFREPLIELSVIQVASPRCIVLGEVSQPGALSLSGDERILDVLSKVGGIRRTASWHDTSNTADLAHALYVRGEHILPIDFAALLQNGDQRHNIRVHPGDYLYIPSTLNQEFFVLGAVNQPGMFRLRAETTVIRGLALAGGHTRDAYIDRALLIRGTRSRPLAGNLDLQAVLTGRAPDLVLQRGDILYLPGRTSENPRHWLDSFNNSFVTSATSRFASDLYDRLRER